MRSTHSYSAAVVQMITPDDVTTYTEDFSGGLGGWTGGNVTVSTAITRSAAQAMRVTYNGTTAANDGLASRTMGVLPGFKYRLKLWVRSDTSAAKGVTINTGTQSGGGNTFSLTANQWKQIQIVFTPGITAPTFTISVPKVTAGSSVYIDDISLSYTPADTPVTTDLPITGGRVDLDEGWSPYVQGRLTIPIPGMQVQEKIDPRVNPRILITCRVSYPDGSMPDLTRTFDLFIRERTISHKDGTIELRVESDEALLWDYALLGSAPRPASTISAITAVRETLATVVPSAVPLLLADLSTKPVITRTNRIVNPSAAAAVTGWTGQAAIVSRSTVWAAYSPASFQVAPSSTTDNDSYMVSSVSLTASRTYTVSGTIYVPAAQTGNLYPGRARSIQVVLNDGTALAVQDTGSAQAPNAAGATRLSFTFTTPDTLTGAVQLRFYAGSLSGGGGVYWDGLLLEADVDESRPYFDGSFTSSPEVSYAWTGTANASTSTAVTRAAVTAEAATWQPGQTAWDYLSGLLDAVGMRLHCDEQRVWRLTDNSYSVPGSLRIAVGSNLTDGADTMSRTNGSWYSGVQMTYTWEDKDGNRQTRYDYAGTPEKVYRLELEKAYPGAGAASYILSRASGRGRTFDLTALSDFTAKPGQEIKATLPGTPLQVGYVTAVSYNLNSAEMTVSSRGLIDTPPTAWLLQPDEMTWESLDSSVTWANFTA